MDPYVKSMGRLETMGAMKTIGTTKHKYHGNYGNHRKRGTARSIETYKNHKMSRNKKLRVAHPKSTPKCTFRINTAPRFNFSMMPTPICGRSSVSEKQGMHRDQHAQCSQVCKSPSRVLVPKLRRPNQHNQQAPAPTNPAKNQHKKAPAPAVPARQAEPASTSNAPTGPAEPASTSTRITKWTSSTGRYQNLPLRVTRPAKPTAPGTTSTRLSWDRFYNILSPRKTRSKGHIWRTILEQHEEKTRCKKHLDATLLVGHVLFRKTSVSTTMCASFSIGLSRIFCVVRVWFCGMVVPAWVVWWSGQQNVRLATCHATFLYKYAKWIPETTCFKLRGPSLALLLTQQFCPVQ